MSCKLGLCFERAMASVIPAMPAPTMAIDIGSFEFEEDILAAQT